MARPRASAQPRWLRTQSKGPPALSGDPASTIASASGTALSLEPWCALQAPSQGLHPGLQGLRWLRGLRVTRHRTTHSRPAPPPRAPPPQGLLPHQTPPHAPPPHAPPPHRVLSKHRVLPQRRVLPVAAPPRTPRCARMPPRMSAPGLGTGSPLPLTGSRRPPCSCWA